MRRLLVVSGVLTLMGLALMVWSMLQPTPLPVMLAMSVGQAVGTMAFGIYGYVIVRDLRRTRRARRDSSRQIPLAAAVVAIDPDEVEDALSRKPR